MEVTIKIGPEDRVSSKFFEEVYLFLENHEILVEIIPCQLDEGSDFPDRTVPSSWYTQFWHLEPRIARRVVLLEMTPHDILLRVRAGGHFFGEERLDNAVEEAVAQVLERV